MAALPGSRTLAAFLRGVGDTVVTGRAHPRPARSSREHWRGVDLTLMANLVLAALLTIPPAPELPPLALFASVLLATALVGRNRWPLATWRLAVMASVCTWLSLSSAPEENVFPLTAQSVVVLLLCSFTVATRSSGWVCVAAGTIVVVSGAMLEAVGSVQSQGQSALLGISTVAALLLGAYIRVTRREAQERVEHSERTAQERHRRAIAEERNRIARELHDVVAHHMAVVAIRAEAATLTRPPPDETLCGELSTIRRSALAALAETRTILSVLRESDVSGSPTSREPWEEGEASPGLDSLDELASSARTAGHPVTLHRTPALPRLSAGVELSTFRIVQEALSNAMRHAPRSSISVQVNHTSDVLRVDVTNGPATTSPHSPPVPGSGQGLMGMRERAAALGGWITAMPTDDGGFRVTAALPLESTEHAL